MKQVGKLAASLYSNKESVSSVSELMILFSHGKIMYTSERNLCEADEEGYICLVKS
jgi:hypothetical protein